MIMLAFFIALWTQQPKMYEPAVKKCIEALASDPDLKKAEDKVQELAKDKTGSVFAPAAIAGYGLGIKHEFKFSSSKFTLIPETTTSVTANKDGGSLNITWRFD